MQSIIEHLSLITKHYGSPITEVALAATIPHNAPLGKDFRILSETLLAHGFENSLAKRPLNNIPSLSTPLILILKDNEAAILISISGTAEQQRFRIRQSRHTEVELDFSELNQRYLGYCWFIKPKTTSDTRSDLPQYTLPKAWFWKVIAQFKIYYFQIIIATILINFLALLSSLYVMQVYDRVIPNQSYETLTALSIGVVIAIVFEFITKLIRGHLTDSAGKKADLIISSALFRRVLALRLVEKPTSSGSYANNLRDFESVREFMTSASLLALVDLPFLLLFVSVIGFIGGKLAFVTLTIIPIIVIVSLLAQKPMARFINESMRESSQRQGLAVEAVEGIETLKVNNAANWAQQKWDFYTAKTAAASIKVRNTSNFIVNFAIAMQQINTVALVIVGTFLIHSNNPADQISMGALIASVILSGRALAPLGQIAGLATRYQSAKHALEGINRITERPIEHHPNRQYIALEDVRGELLFDKVKFAYAPENPTAIQQLQLHIRAGEKVAILGSIGSGKSTLLKLAAGLYEAQQGHITLDNVDIRQLDPTFLRHHIALLNQHPRLFFGSLRENLELARSDNFISSDQDLLLALSRFGLDKLIRKHPKGLDMPLGEDGHGLSGGQKQIIALARLTLRQPRIALLDEPTNGLDPNTENMALHALAQWAHDKTLIIVTHRTQVLKLVDRIIVMDNGNIAIDGARDTVLKQLINNEIAQNTSHHSPS